MVMAIALSRKYSVPIVGIFDRNWDTVPRHVGVAFPNGLFGDARGLGLSREEFLDGFTVDETTEIKQMSELELQRIWSKRIKNWSVGDDDLRELGL